MFFTNELIKFSMENIDFVLSDFKHQTITTPYPLHYHSKDSIEIHYIKSGAGKAILDEATFNVEEGYFFITGPFTVHGQLPNFDNSLEKYSMHFTLDSSKASPELVKMLNNPYYIGKTRYSIDTLLEKIQYEFENKLYGYKDMIAETIKMIFVLLMRHFKQFHEDIDKSSESNNSLFEIESILVNEFKTITLPELAKRLYMSERELQRYLDKNYNKNFNTLKLEARMFYATNQLLYTDKSILEISKDVGYSSCEHFSYAFKKYYNITPLKFRKKEKLDLGIPAN